MSTDNIFQNAENEKKTAKKAPAKSTTAKSKVEELIEDEENSVEETPTPAPTKAPKKAKAVGGKDDLREKIISRLEVIGLPYSEDFSTEDLVKLYEDKMEEYSNTVKPTEIEDLLRQFNKEQANRLVRVRVTCMNPNKSDLKGEYFVTGNRTIGVHKKFVPYNTEAMDSGWHITLALYDHLTSRVFYPASSRKNKFGMDEPVSNAVPEFAIEVLPPLTQVEIDEIAKHQRATNTISRS